MHHAAGEIGVHPLVDRVCGEALAGRLRTEPTAHGAAFDRSGRFLFVPHTETNRIHQFRFIPGTGAIAPNTPATVRGPSGDRLRSPRDFVLHPTLDVGYSANESGGGLTRWSLDPVRGQLSRGETLSTLPPDFGGTSAAAQVAVTPDGRFGYVSNRDLTRRPRGDPMQDTIAAFGLDPESGVPTAIGHFRTTRFPRSMCIGAQGRFVFAAGQQSNRLSVHRIRPEDGKLVRGPLVAVPGEPVALVCID